MPGRIPANERFGTLRPDNFLHVDRTHLKGVSADRERLNRLALTFSIVVIVDFRVYGRGWLATAWLTVGSEVSVAPYVLVRRRRHVLDLARHVASSGGGVA
jgi:hypothetical protein